MGKAILIILTLGIAGLLVYVYKQPSDFQISRSISINAPAAKPFALVNDFHAWEKWSPWAKMDPAAKSTFSGPATGVGSSFAWAGNSKVGEGKMTITESHPNDLIRINLEFIKPFPGSSQVEFSLKPETTGTRVTWNMSGKNTFVQRLICTFMNMDKMVGGQYEKGLAAIKSLSEGKK